MIHKEQMQAKQLRDEVARLKKELEQKNLQATKKNKCCSIFWSSSIVET